MQLLSVVLIRARLSQVSSIWNKNTMSDGLEKKGQDSQTKNRSADFMTCHFCSGVSQLLLSPKRSLECYY